MSNYPLGDGPIDEKYRRLMNDVGKAIDVLFNGPAKGAKRETGFVLLVFPFGEHTGRCNFLSNGADRRDIIELFKEMIKRFESLPNAEVGKRGPRNG